MTIPDSPIRRDEVSTTNPDSASTIHGRRAGSIAIAARVTLSAHALNNEGSRNNATLPRQVNVATPGEIVQTNAVSGDTFKHAFVEYLRAYAADASSTALLLCDPCRRGNANRSNADPSFGDFCQQHENNLVGNEAVLAELVRRCVVCDVAGLLVTVGQGGRPGGRNAPRPSRVHFGWVVGVPDRVATGRYTHVKLVPGSGEEEAASNDEGSNLGQNIFTRPASSGDYALVVRAELDRIGVHDMTRKPVVDEPVRHARVLATMAALYQTVAAPDGAQVNTQLPHLQAVSGAVSVSFSSLPAPLFSPLQHDFVDQMSQIAKAFTALRHGAAPSSDPESRGAVTSQPDPLVISFASVGELGQNLAHVGRPFATPESAEPG